MDKTQHKCLPFADRVGSFLIGAGLGYICLRDFRYAILVASAFIFVGAVAKIVVSDIARREKQHSQRQAEPCDEPNAG
jgi:hypothetical protein